MEVNHKYDKKNIRNLKINEDADCKTCALAERTKWDDGDGVLLCHAALYDIKTLSCYIPNSDFCVVRKEVID